MKLTTLISTLATTAVVLVSGAPALPPKEVLEAIENGTVSPACTTYCYPAGGTTQCYCF